MKKYRIFSKIIPECVWYIQRWYFDVPRGMLPVQIPCGKWARQRQHIKGDLAMEFMLLAGGLVIIIIAVVVSVVSSVVSAVAADQDIED